MTDLAGNILAYRKAQGLSRAALAEKMGVHSDKIRHIETGHQRADHEFLYNFAEITGADLNALFGVSGKSTNFTPSDLANVADFVAIPRYEVAASAGQGSLVGAEIGSGHYSFNRKWIDRRGLNPKDLSVIGVAGDSMEPELYDGDVIVVDKSSAKFRNSKMYAVRYDGSLYVKRVQMLPHNRVQMLSSNRFYPPIVVDYEAGEHIDVVGQVVASMHEW